MLQLAGLLMPWTLVTERPSKHQPQWWSQNWSVDGEYICKCGAENAV